MVKDTNNSVINSLKRQKQNYKSLLKADKLYSNWADKYLADEIEPLLKFKINDPEKIFENITSNQGVYRAFKNAVGSKQKRLIDQADQVWTKKTW